MSVGASNVIHPQHRLSDIADNPNVIEASVNQNIHPKDGMFRDNIVHYNRCGRDAVKKICGALTLTGSRTPSSILDLACGYGRVTRWLSAAFPDAQIVVSDTDKTAVNICSAQFDAEPHFSNGSFLNSEFTNRFDLIWSGSLMTHLDSDSAAEMFAFMSNSLKAGGLAVFTVHGRYVASRVNNEKWPYNLTEPAFRAISDDYLSGTYGFTDYEGMNGYGISLTPMPWLFSRLSEDKTIRLVAYTERGWDNHQDLVAFVKTPI